MATRSTIALEFADGTVQQVYCHWDGYLDNNGKILFENYADAFKLRELIDLGDLSSLGSEVGVKRPFDNPGKYGSPEYTAFQELYANQCCFYARDRGETGTDAKKFKNFADYVANHQYEEYEYILRNVNGTATWFVAEHSNTYVPLVEALATVEETA
jgi:hypothetical protein